MPPRIALFGCGRWGRTILRDLLALGCQVTVIDPDEGARAAAIAAGAVSALASDDGRPRDGVVIATPTSTHAQVVLALCDGGVPLFVEKPLCADPAAARRIREHARCPIHVMDKWRYHPAVVRLAAIARSGELGNVIALRTQRLQPAHLHADVDALWTLAPHDLSIARAILGRIPPLRAARLEGVPTARQGVVASFGGDPGNPGAAPTFEMRISTTHPTTVRGISLQCARGTANMDDPLANRIRVERASDSAVTVEQLSGEPPLLAELRAFVSYLAGGPPPLGTLDEAVDTVELIAALGN